jgi:nicotinamidase-related amidase
MATKTIAADPFDLVFDPATTALLMIDMQRDFVEPKGFGELLGNDVSLVRAAIEPCRAVLAAARASGMFVLHTREGHRPDLADCPPAKLTRGGKTFIGTEGPMGRVLVRGEKGPASGPRGQRAGRQKRRTLGRVVQRVPARPRVT